MTDLVRPAAVAGRFYPGDPDELRALVEDQLADVRAEPAPAVAAVVPHAGLIYSGRCAAHVFRRIAFPPVVVLIGPNHTGRVGSGCPAGVWARGSFRTPLGDVAVDEAWTSDLMARCPLVAADPVAHATEHALEVELPFLQVFPSTPRIVPIVLATDDWEICRALAEAIVASAAQVGGDALLLASSDMTHYESAERAGRQDRLALKAIERLDAEGLLAACRRHRISMCGRAAAAVVVEAARRLGATSAGLVDYRHSGLVTRDHESVVTYAGVVIR